MHVRPFHQEITISTFVLKLLAACDKYVFYNAFKIASLRMCCVCVVYNRVRIWCVDVTYMLQRFYTTDN